MRPRRAESVPSADDDVLEKGNRDMKNFKELTWLGGKSTTVAQATKVKQTRYRLIREARDGEEAEYEPYEPYGVEVQRQHSTPRGSSV